MNINTIWLFVTNNCNLDCSYCYIKKNPKDIKLETAYKIIDKLINDSFFKEHHVVLFGGEPLLRIALIKEIVEYGYRRAESCYKKLTFSIYSNGTLMNDYNVKSLHKLGIGLDLSLDGIKESHDQERLFKNQLSSFDIIAKNIPILLKYYPYSMVHACITPKNIQYLSKNVDFFYDVGFKRVALQPIISTHWPKHDLNTFRRGLKKVFIKYRDLINNGRELYLNILEDYIKKIQTNNPCFTTCSAGINYFAFSTDGDIFPCHRFVTLGQETEFKYLENRYKLGNIENDIINEELYKHFTNFTLEKNERCKNCKIKNICCSYCHWEHFHENKEYSKINETVCTIQNIIVDEVKNILGEYPELSTLNFINKFRGLNIPKNHQ